MMIRSVLIIILIFSSSIWASSNTHLDAYLNFNYDGMDNELIENHIGQVENYINSYNGNKNDPVHIGLLKLHANAKNYMSLTEALSDCNDNDRMLSSRILGVVGNEIKEKGMIVVPCRAVNDPFPEVNNLAGSVEDATNLYITNNLQKDLYERSVVNSMKSLMLHQFQFRQKNFSSDYVINNFIKENCKQNCSEDLYTRTGWRDSKLFKELKSYVDGVRTQERFSAQTASAHLNNLIDGEEGLNRLLESTEQLVGYDDGIVNDDPIFDMTSTMLHSYYQSRYNKIATVDPVGKLLNTEDLREQVRMPRRADEDDMKEVGKSFIFKKHRRVTPNQISTAANEVTQKIKDQISSLNETDKKRDEDERKYLHPRNTNSYYYAANQRRNKDLNEMIRTNPLAVGQQLFEDPIYAQRVCKSIDSISKKDDRDGLIDDIWLYGGLIVGGALLVTGIGAGVGAWVLAGTASGATLATVAATSSIAGIALGLSEAGYHTNRYFEARADQAILERAVLSGAGDEKTANEAVDAIVELREAKYAAIMSGAFSAVELGMLAKVATISMYGAKIASSAQTVRRAKWLTDSLNKIATNPKYINLMKTLRETIGSEKAAKFMGHLFTMSENLRISMLEKLSAMAQAGDLQGLQRIVDEALEVAQKHCGI